MPGVHSARARELALAFDRGFAAPREAPPERPDDFLAIHVAGAPHALRLAQIDGLHAAGEATWVPGPVAELRGIVSLRGRLLPVYDLAALLGEPAAAAPRWLVVAAGETVGFAFDAFDGHFRAPASAVAISEGCESVFVRQVVGTAEGPRPVLDLGFLIDKVRRLLPPPTA